jgi:hypothetical protein
MVLTTAALSIARSSPYPGLTQNVRVAKVGALREVAIWKDSLIEGSSELAGGIRCATDGVSPAVRVGQDFSINTRFQAVGLGCCPLLEAEDRVVAVEEVEETPPGTTLTANCEPREYVRRIGRSAK